MNPILNQYIEGSPSLPKTHHQLRTGGAEVLWKYLLRNGIKKVVTRQGGAATHQISQRAVSSE